MYTWHYLLTKKKKKKSVITTNNKKFIYIWIMFSFPKQNFMPKRHCLFEK